MLLPRSAAVLAALFLLLPVLRAQTPLLDPAAETTTLGQTPQRFLREAADRALESGFASLAAELYARLLSEAPAGFPAEERAQVLLGRASALLATGQPSEALSLLQEPLVAARPEARLRRALALESLGRVDEARAVREQLDGDDLPAEDRAWLYLLDGLLTAAGGDARGAEEDFARARELAAHPAQAARFEYLRLRSVLLSGRADEETERSLRAQMERFRGQSAAFAFARQLATLLHRQGRTSEALDLLTRELAFVREGERAERARFLLLIALIAGPSSGQGRLALENTLRERLPATYGRLALELLGTAALAGESPGAFTALLDDLLATEPPHPLRDELLYFRGELALRAGSLDRAAELFGELRDTYPGSPLVENALRGLAYVAWRRDPPAYRTAADWLLRLRERTTVAERRVRLAVLAGDCFFLNGDYARAADAYGSALAETTDPALTGTLLYQQVLGEIYANRLDRAAAHLDDPQARARAEVDSLWRAEWNLISELKLRGDVAAAFERVGRLLGEESAASTAPELRLRLLWLDAQLSLEARQVKETPFRVDRLREGLAALPEGAIDPVERATLQSHATLLEAQAFLALGQSNRAYGLLEDLREEHPGSEPAQLSYLLQARQMAAEGQLLEAQSLYTSLADAFPQSPHAPLALYEAALAAARLGTTPARQTAAALLDRLASSYPDHPLVFHARLQQGHLVRELGEFGSALNLYEQLLTRFPDHPQRFLAELSRADCFLAQAGRDRGALEEAVAILERLTEVPGVPEDVRAEAGFKLGFALRRQGNDARAREAWWLNLTRRLPELREPVASGNAAVSALVPREASRTPYWLARSALELGALHEETGERDHARELYAMVLDYGLPGAAVARDRLERLDGPSR